MNENYFYTIDLIDLCEKYKIPIVYASSASYEFQIVLIKIKMMLKLLFYIKISSRYHVDQKQKTKN